MVVAKPSTNLPLPDHKQLPESDGTFVKNFQEHPQSLLLTSSIQPVLETLHPNGQYTIGQDCGIYWNLTDPPERGAEAPDWFYVPNVPPLLDGERRRSYVLWKEKVIPAIALEFVSGNGEEERDNTASSETTKAGKFWVYEQAVKIPFYGIYEVDKATVEVYQLVAGRYQRCVPDDRGHYFIPPLGIALGIWQGEYMHQNLPWLRWWDAAGNLLLSGDERAEVEKQRADLEQQRATQEQQRADTQQQRAIQEQQRADDEQQRATQEKQRADRLAAKLRELGIDPQDI